MPVKARQGGTGRVRGGRPGAQQGGGSSPGAPSVSDWFVDSVAGSDANNGTTQATPFATLGTLATAITAQPSKTTVSLKRGSQFRESLPGTVTSCIDYGTGNLPIIDGSNVITGWTVNGTQAAVWEKSLTIETGGRPRIYEDGVLMPWVADLATCATTPGSRVLLDNGGAITLQMHPTGGGNPNSNGKVYEATSRASPVLMGDNCILKGIHARRGISNNGAVQMGRNAVIERCLSVDGSKHNLLLASGTLTDCILSRADAPTPTEISTVLLAGFDSSGINGLGVSLQRVGFIPESDGILSFISHDLDGGSYATLTAEQIWFVRSQAFSPRADVQSIQGYYAEECVTPSGGGYASQMTLDCFQVKNTSLHVDGGFSGFNALTNVIPEILKLKDGAVYAEGSSDGFLRLQSGMNGYALAIQNVAFTTSLGVSRVAITDEGWSSGTMSVQGSIFHTSPYGTGIAIPTGITYVGDNNVFAEQDGGGGEALRYHGTLYVGVAPWQAGTGQDPNSFEFEGRYVAQLFSGTYSAGDYRLAGTGIGASAATIGAGPQNHWNWNTRSKVSGPPTGWPTVPKTLAEAITYVSNPTGWSW